MKILHYLKSIRLEEGGVVRAVLDFCTALSAAGHDVVLATFDDQDAPAEWPRVDAARAWSGRGARVVRLPKPAKPGARFDGAALAQVRAAVGGADVAHIHAVWIPTNLQVARAARASGTPYIVTIHGMLDDWSMSQRRLKKKIFLSLGGRAYLENAALVHSTAEFERRQSLKWYPRAESRAVVAPLLFDLAPFRNLPVPDAARAAFPLAASSLPKLLFLSRVHEKKGLPHLIRAARILKDQGQPAALLIAGTGEPAYVEQMKSLARDEGVADTTAFLGMVTGDTKVSLFQAADLFVLPTSQENFGFAPVEAMACGTVAVTTKGVDIWPELESSGGAVIADPAPTALAATLSELLAGDARRKAMGESARRWVMDWLDPERVIGQYVAMYERAAASRKGA